MPIQQPEQLDQGHWRLCLAIKPKKLIDHGKAANRSGLNQAK
jgi:hypothetical protein